jgi:hypothetical protein
MRPFRGLLAGSLLTCVAGCNTSIPTSPADPSPPVPQSYVVSGIASEMVDGISRPVAGRKVDLYISGICEQIRPGADCAREKAEVVETDQNGRYTVQVQVPDTRPLSPKPRVFVSGAGLHAAGQQPCLATALLDKDTTIDVQVFPVDSSSTPPPAADPMITGVVYEMTPLGRKPLPGVWAWLAVGFSDSYPMARTQTDNAGRFFFCRVNAPVKMGVGDWPPQFIPGTGDMFFEIELKR